MSEEELALVLNITLQQVQKYEKGLSRISAGRLHDIAAALRVPLQFLYQGCSQAVDPKGGEEVLKLAQLMASPEVVSLLQAIASFKNPKIRQLMSALAAAITEEIALDNPAPQGLIRQSSLGR
jgi:transcriptional regulator with XRE-family HTH domain